MGKLNALRVQRLSKPGLHGDGAGLYLQIGRGGGKSWAFRYRLRGKDRQMGLGPYPTITLSDARELATSAKRSVLAGTDPIAARAADRQAERRIPTFAHAANDFIAAKQAEWKNDKHREQWSSTLATYAYPILGSLRVDEIEMHHVLAVLKPIWTDKTETASRLRGRIEAVLDSAFVDIGSNAPNPARWRGFLDKKLGKPSLLKNVRHHPALPYRLIGEFMAELRERQGIGARAVEFAILTAARSGEVRLADWSEFDLQERLWSIPADRMKAGRPHRVPLSRPAIAVLETMSQISRDGLVFPGAKRGAPLSDMSLTATLRRIDQQAPGKFLSTEGDPISTHGFRACFRDWCGEVTQHSDEVAELALAHAVGNATSRAYRRDDALPKRRRLMQDWADYCGVVREPGRVHLLAREQSLV